MNLECKQLEFFQANQLSVVHLKTAHVTGQIVNIVPSVFTLLIKYFQGVILNDLKQYDRFVQR